MTTLSATTPTFDSASLRVKTRRVIRSEWIKLRTLRSNWITSGAVAVVLAGVGLIAGFTTSSAADLSEAGAFTLTLGGVGLAVLLVGALGALVGAREHGSDMIRTTAAAVPRRSGIVLARAVSLIALLTPAVAVGVLLAAAFGTSIQRAHAVATLSLTDPLALRAMIGNVIYLVGVALIGMAVGTMLRSVAGSVATVIGVVLVLPSILTALLPASWDRVLDALPASAGEALTTIAGGASMSPAAGLVTFLLWVLAAVAGSAAAMPVSYGRQPR